MPIADIISTYYFESLLVTAIIIVFCVLFLLFRKMSKLIKKRDEERIGERLKALEEELEEYMVRSQRRLDIFRRIIDGFDTIIQGVKGVLAEEERDTLQHTLAKDKQDLLADQDKGKQKEKKEAEIIRIDSSFDDT